MGLSCLSSKFLSRYSMFEKQSMKVAPCYPSFLGSCRYVAPALPKEPQDRLTLELADEPLLPSEQPVVGLTGEASGFLQVKWQVLGLDRPISGQNDSPLDDVLELTEVARPGIPF